MKHSIFLWLIGLLILLQACRNQKTITKAQELPDIPKAEKEFRAAWVATVANINWPSKPGLSTDEQKNEAILLLDFLKQHRFNAVILQVRPQCDALYESKLEPWSYYLSGQQGKAPEPFYDPLEFWIEAAHDRGLELHVWLNPYRAHHKDGKEITEHSIVKKRPELAVFLKEGYWWLDPSLQGTQDHSTAVVMDIVKRYDLDGVHFDDYFYPYPSYNGGSDFPDSTSWDAYRKSGGKLSRSDWRRHSVNVFIERVYKEIKAEKPQVKFGLSPFGVWRPGYPESITGFDQYDQLYADAKLWLNNGWIDYFTPQLYWPINSPGQSFPILLGWWAEENKKGRHLWPGISVGRDTTEKNTTEVLNQLMISKGMLTQSKGVVHWSISSLTRNPALAKAIALTAYRKPALVPPSPWLDNDPPGAPVVSINNQDTTVKISWSPADESDVFRWVLYYKYGNGAWQYMILDRKDREAALNRQSPIRGIVTDLTRVGVTAVDRTGNESKLAETVMK